MRKLLRSIIAATVAVSLIAVPVLADDIDTLTKQRQEAEEQVDNIEGQKDAAQAEQTELQNQLTELLTKMSDLEAQLILKGQEIILAEDALTEAQIKERSQYTAMKLRIKFMYENGNSTILMAIISSENLSDVINRVEYANEISSYDRDMINKFIDTQNEIKEIKAQLETEKEELLEVQAQYEAEQTNLDNLIAEKSVEIENFQEQLDAAIAAAAEAAAKEEQAIAEEEARLAAEEAARQAAQEAARRNQQSSSSSGSDSSSSSGSTYIGYNPNTGNTIVDTAYTQLGVPYVWGGSTPYVALDCSGLVQYCYACAGISIPRTSAAMVASGTVVTDPQPGDICWTPGHVAIYIGNGQMIEAQQSGVPVCISAVRVSKYLRFE